MTNRLLFVLLLLVTAPIVSTAQAPGGGSRLSFAATIESIKATVRPAEVLTRQFRLTLDPGQPRTRFRARVEDWWRSEDNGQSHYAAPGTIGRSCARWVSVNPVESVVDAEETLVVRLTINVPTGVEDGGYWCALTVEEVPDPETMPRAAGVKFLASVSTGVFLYAGNIRREASIVDLQVTADKALITVRNDGNAPIGVEGRLEFLTGDADRSVSTTPLPRTTVLTEPVARGVVAAALPAESILPSGRYRVRAILDFGGEHLIGAEREIEVLRQAQPNGAFR